MKATIKLVVPSYGFDTVDVVYHTNPVGSKRLYAFDFMHQSYRGKPVRELDIEAVLSLNSYEEIEEAIIAKTQGNHRIGLEADAANPRIQKPESGKRKFNFKKQSNQIPE